MALDYDELIDRPKINGHILTGDQSSEDLDINKHHYSTTEQVVGTWIDGDPVYEKVYYESFESGETRLTISLTDCDTDSKILSVNGFAIPSDQPNNIQYLNTQNNLIWIAECTNEYCIIDRDDASHLGTAPTVYITVRYTKSVS